MTTIPHRLLLPFLTLLLLGACSSGSSDPISDNNETSDITNNGEPTPDNGETPDANNGESAPDSGDTPVIVDTASLATNGCQNTVILNGFAYAACGDGIELVNLQSLERNFISQPADDITGDANLGVLFTQSGDTLLQFDLTDPMQPDLIATMETNFLIFSGISAANGILAVSGGSSNANTQVYSYDSDSLTLLLSGIPLVDSRTGNPDVHLAPTNNGALAFYSEDLGLVANWGIQIIEFDTSGNILAQPDVVVLTPGQYTGVFGPPVGPANFPLESEFLIDRLYVAHFAANGIQVIDRSANDSLSLIPLGYEPINIATDGNQLFVVSLERSSVDIISPVTETVVETLSLPLQQPTGIAATATHIAVADRTSGLIIMQR